jgi:hypothetical protein
MIAIGRRVILGTGLLQKNIFNTAKDHNSLLIWKYLHSVSKCCGVLRYVERIHKTMDTIALHPGGGVNSMVSHS